MLRLVCIRKTRQKALDTFYCHSKREGERLLSQPSWVWTLPRNIATPAISRPVFAQMSLGVFIVFRKYGNIYVSRKSLLRSSQKCFQMQMDSELLDSAKKNLKILHGLNSKRVKAKKEWASPPAGTLGLLPWLNCVLKESQSTSAG